MLSKLLKYDLKFLFKYWWIGAVASIVCAFITGMVNRVEWSGREYDYVVYVILGIVGTISNMGIAVFVVLGSVLIFIRYYRNFFTDEGYLTFTLPAKRSDLLNSKLISGFLLTLGTTIVYVLDNIIINILTYEKDNYMQSVEAEEVITASEAFFIFITLIEFIVIVLVSVLFVNVFIFFCITIGSTITRKARVITSIGFCYGLGMEIITLSIFMLFAGVVCLDPWFGPLDGGAAFYMPFSVVLLMIILFIGALTAILYTVTLNLIKGKLNLR